MFRRSPAIFDTYVVTPDNTINGVPILFRNRCQDLDLDRVVAGEVIVSNCPMNVPSCMESEPSSLPFDAMTVPNGISADAVEWPPTSTLVKSSKLAMAKV